MSTWQTMESAPRDETTVLLYCPDSWDTDGIRVGWWHEGAWYADESSSYPLSDLYGDPTHWMPIPAPPQPGESNARIIAGPKEKMK